MNIDLSIICFFIYIFCSCLLDFSYSLSFRYFNRLKEKKNVFIQYSIKNHIAFGYLFFFIRLLYSFCFVSIASKQYIQTQRQKHTMEKKTRKEIQAEETYS
jgi:hypothetical protein